ncbi:terpenoid synthase [Stereum hirsutum FP-91666 SS1]|uniref:terpenoid synthase n=1 Tax=Stereum hirsutum (strain FP-91666) TaxID=721885 RepID=UPI000444A8F8|nr:terpenoid synthase [Stereum hirsutum FP-91666 SS1]EIM82223.1 terpenoid synthase [Stereum hirsutum FP-91666 SS1]
MVRSPVSDKFCIPDTLASWPYPRILNPHYAEEKAASAAWTKGFGAFGPKAQDAFDRCDFKRCRSGCDLMNLFFVIDEHSDTHGEETVRKMKDVVMDAIRNPHKPRPNDEWIGGEIARQFWERAMCYASEISQRRFIDTFDEYLESVVDQAADRDSARIRDIESYINIRRNTIGAKPSFVIMEQGMDIPDNVFENEVFQRLRMATIDMLCLGNDIVSYNIEQARGDDSHNIVRIVMNELDTDVPRAMDWVAQRHTQLEREFFTALSELPTWGEPIDGWVKEYVYGLGNWVRANDQWSFESQRYFGTKGMEIMKSRWLSVLPKVRPAEVGPQLVDQSLL